MEETTSVRTDDEIMARAVPGHSVIVLGGREYPVREASNSRARDIRLAIAEFGEAIGKFKENDPRTLEYMEQMLDRAIRRFSPEIESDWTRVADEATDTERLAAMAIIREVVMLPFSMLAGSLPGSVSAAKAKATKARKRTGRR